MRLLGTVLLTTFVFMGANAAEFVNYKALATKLVKENKTNGLYATVDEVKKAIKSKNWLVADVRTKEEWASAHIKGTVRIGRQAPENGLALHVEDDDGKFIKDNLIVICNSAKRASIEAETFRKMGFKTVKVFDLYKWIDNCNPVKTNYSVKKFKTGTGIKFGSFYAQHCNR